MAEVLETADLLSQQFEPKRKFRWILSIDGIDAFTLKTAQRPNIVFDETVIDYINVKRYVAGKATWQPITITTQDPIVPSAAQKVMEWVRLCFENTTGRMGYTQFYKKEINLKLLDPVGAVVENFRIQGAWAQEVNFGDLDYSTSDNVEISVTIRFDQAYLLY